MIAEVAVWLGRRLARGPTAGADYWAHRVWDREACAAEPVLGPHYRVEADEMRALVDDAVMATGVHPARLRAVDVGCGVGVFTETLLRAGVGEVTAVDVSADALARTRIRVRDDERLITHQGDVRRFTPAEGQFDVLVCIDALHHIGDPIRVLTELARLILPGGVAICNVWTADHFHEFQRLRRGNIGHTVASLQFCAESALSRFGRRSGALRTELVDAVELRTRLAERFDIVVVAMSRYWLRFVVRC